MDRKDRSRIDRLYDVVNAVPRIAGGGTATRTASALIGYTQDMELLSIAIKEVLFGIMSIDCGNEELIEDEATEIPIGC